MLLGPGVATYQRGAFVLPEPAPCQHAGSHVSQQSTVKSHRRLALDQTSTHRFYATNALLCVLYATIGGNGHARKRRSRGPSICRSPALHSSSQDDSRLVKADSQIRCPAEWEPHQKTLVGWPSEQLVGSKIRRAGFDFFSEAQYEELVGLINAISAREPVAVVVGPEDLPHCKARLASIAGVEFLEVSHVNWWIRDTGPTFTHQNATSDRTCTSAQVDHATLAAVRWDFHGYDIPIDDLGRRNFYGTYYPTGGNGQLQSGWKEGVTVDVELARCVAKTVGVSSLAEPSGFSFEGGAVVCDGEGTGIVVEDIMSRTGLVEKGVPAEQSLMLQSKNFCCTPEHA